MGGFDNEAPRPAAQAAAPLLPHEMEHIRKVYDEVVGSKKHSSIISPREDAQMFRNVDRHAVSSECIIELYELLWRWGHRNPQGRGFAENFGFAIPDTVVIVKGRPYAWYFISKKDGSLLRKTDGNLSLHNMEKKLVAESRDPQGLNSNVPVAVWLPMASQFPEARCHSPYGDFMSAKGLSRFIMGLRDTHSGIIQAFVEPHGVSNFLIRTVEFRRQTALSVRTNRSLLSSGKGTVFDRCATFEGWEGLSSMSSRYRSHRHPHMEELILAASETLTRRIEQERVRQMLFLGPHLHVALHFKVNSDHMLYFIFASIVTEKDVILQTRPLLLMGDPCMTEELPGAALLPGGTTRKAQPFEAPPCYSARGSGGARALVEKEEEEEARKASRESRDRNLPTVEAAEGGSATMTLRRPPRPSSGRGPNSARQRQYSAQRRHVMEKSLLPRMMGYEKPIVPEVPYKTLDVPRHVEDYETFVALANETMESVKRPLVSTQNSQVLSDRPPAASAK
eukprot:TRINITY_DN47151_c0_g1_i1.p1 TRINITY_DN47151_c0_g1~~TRINITY_DN47151_c0_g1_i1.p1  ORF type:complete len:508 (+),score=68.59 TRINITY_DN47151_c0_g1_i1:67-1590(+)